MTIFYKMPVYGFGIVFIQECYISRDFVHRVGVGINIYFLKWYFRFSPGEGEE